MTSIPCNCGQTDARWHGNAEGLRAYSCDCCWAEQTFTYMLSQYNEGEKTLSDLLGWVLIYGVSDAQKDKVLKLCHAHFVRQEREAMDVPVVHLFSRMAVSRQR